MHSEKVDVESDSWLVRNPFAQVAKFTISWNLSRVPLFSTSKKKSECFAQSFIFKELHIFDILSLSR